MKCETYQYQTDLISAMMPRCSLLGIGTHQYEVLRDTQAVNGRITSVNR